MTVTSAPLGTVTVTTGGVPRSPFPGTLGSATLGSGTLGNPLAYRDPGAGWGLQVAQEAPQAAVTTTAPV